MSQLDQIEIRLSRIEEAIWRIEQRQQGRDPNLERLRQLEQPNYDLQQFSQVNIERSRS